MKAIQTIIRPVVTEKAIRMNDTFTYAFYVNARATKIDVKEAVKELYGHEVDTVRMLITPKKVRGGRGRVATKRQRMKKALVTLKGRKKIDLTKVSKEKKK
ncbi:MAG: 50S ribosomal protein L23 [Candidatus Gracilibacteria bacterium]